MFNKPENSKKYSNINLFVRDLFFFSMYVCYTGSRWYTPDLNVVTNDILAFVPPLH